jgi:hypothetical protein
MDRRKIIKLGGGIIAAGGVGLFALSTAFKTKNQPVAETEDLKYNQSEDNWKYSSLDPANTGELAYKYYSEGSCMYATVKSVISQLAEKFGEPYSSFPCELFKYGHGGIGGYGSVCGALNGAAALIGLLINDKQVQDRMISDIFQWYEKESLPKFTPQNQGSDFTPPTSISNSVLCHASNTNWSNISGFTVDSKERKERCRRLTGDVAMKVTDSFNQIFASAYIPGTHIDETSGTCITCHGDEGKVSNTAVKMSCNSCHTESIGHKVFADVHYKMMK